MSFFKKLGKSIGKALGIGGSPKPVVVDPVAQEAEQKRLAQMNVNKATAADIQGQQQSLAPSADPNTVQTVTNPAQTALPVRKNIFRSGWKGVFFNKNNNTSNNTLLNKIQQAIKEKGGL